MTRLASPELVSRTRATRLLKALPRESTEALEAALQRSVTRSEAARVLGELRDPRSTQALLDQLSSPDPVARRAIAQALGRIRDPRAAEGLMEASSDRDLGVREAAIEALRELGPAGTLYGFVALARTLLPQLEVGERADALVQLLASAHGVQPPVDTTADPVDPGGAEQLTLEPPRAEEPAEPVAPGPEDPAQAVEPEEQPKAAPPPTKIPPAKRSSGRRRALRWLGWARG